jgi:adenosine 3'-phospho 5'-phosphosulfate transporter B3
VLFKSCRVLPTMVFGVVVYRKRYSSREWCAMAMLVCGLVLFMQADMHASPELHPMGIAFIVAALALDAGILNVQVVVACTADPLNVHAPHMPAHMPAVLFLCIYFTAGALSLFLIVIPLCAVFQDYCFTHFGSSEDEVVFASYAGGSLLLLAACLATGELTAALAFVDANFASSRAVPVVSLGAFATCGYCGVLCVTGLTRRFGPLVASLTTTARKAVTLVLSFALFPKPVNGGHFLGAALFVAGIVVKATAPHRRRSRLPLPPPPPPVSSSPNDKANSSGGNGFGQHAPPLFSAPSPSELPSGASPMTAGSQLAFASGLSDRLLSPHQHLGAHQSAPLSKAPEEVV